MEISIIMPCYNASKYLPKCLDSLEKQTFKDFELIAINDLSTDNTLEILKEAKRKLAQLEKEATQSEAEKEKATAEAKAKAERDAKINQAMIKLRAEQVKK